MQLESFTCHKDPRAPLANDDRVVVYGGRLFAVIDGVTAKKGPPLPDGSSRGQAAGVLIERALRELVDDRTAMTAGADEVLERIRRTIVGEYARLDMTEAALDPHLRFAAQLACAFYDGSHWRLLVVGDCGVRLNGEEVIATTNPGDGVIALLRAHVFAAAREHLRAATGDAGVTQHLTDTALDVARAYTVMGSSSFLHEHAEALPQADYRACAAAAESAALEAFPNLPAALVRDTLAHGLLGIGVHRNTAGPLGAPCIDGTVVPPELVHDRRLAAADVSTLELFSDGYFGTPPAGEVTVAAWEAHIAHVEDVDPFKVGQYPSTKGSGSGRFTDDRTVLIATPPARGMKET